MPTYRTRNLVLFGAAVAVLAGGWTASLRELVPEARAQDTTTGRRDAKASLLAAKSLTDAAASDEAKAQAAAARTAVLPATTFGKGQGGSGAGAGNLKAFVELLDRVTVGDARTAGANAVVDCTLDGATYQVPMKSAGEFWSVDAAQFFVLGKPVAERNGAKAARTVLDARTDKTRGYGSTGVSFVHVTQRSDDCNGRIDAWYCWNGDLHIGGENLVTLVSQTSLDAVKSIPAAAPADWTDKLRPKAGQVGVMRCRRDGDHDFYVAFRVAKVTDDALTLEWKLLAIGFGAPASITTEQPYSGHDGGDGADGLCGRNGR